MLLALGVIIGFFFVVAVTDADTWVPLITIMMLALISLPICGWLAGRPRDSRLYKLLVIGMLLKILMAGPRYYLSEVYYDGEGDAGRYHQAGVYFIDNLTKGEWDIAPAELTAFPRETRVVGYVVGVLYSALGTTFFGGFVAFSWLAWVGLMFFFRAYRIAYPNAPPYLVAKLLIFFPSLLFWPSSLGKDALMVFLLGLFTLGASRVLSNRLLGLGIVWIALAGYGILQIRPHLLLVGAVAMALATLTQPTGSTGYRGAALRIAVILLVLPLLVVAVGRLDTVFGTEGESLTENLNSTVDQTAIGGSAFEARPVRAPQDVVLATLTVLYRPFVFEADSFTVLIAALESVGLLVLTILAARWIWRIGPTMYRWPFAGYCGAYVLAFIVAFSNVANAGILARQRVQMFPLLMLLVAATKEFHDRTIAAEVASQAAMHDDGPIVRPAVAPRST
ncbi:MAG: hypothetical protein KDA98_04035 [Acidimicrobiales bacterium]|nr:hypothetical protein [Acidimicrobiales bacterium]